MPFGLRLYRFLTRVIGPLLPLLLRRRANKGKENSGRLNERFAKSLPLRPAGLLLWCHAASVGESKLLLEMAARIAQDVPDAHFLFTCQTLTGADIITASLQTDERLASAWTLQQMAPMDTPGTAERFVEHWRPDLSVFCEGDIWPNLLHQLKQQNRHVALINARMTMKTINMWRRFSKTGLYVFGAFSTIISGDKRTATALKEITQRDIPAPGNLKSSLPLPAVDRAELLRLSQALKGRTVLVAASTHEGEEALIIDVAMQMDRKPFLVIAPRHPARGDRIAALLQMSGLSFERRSEGTITNLHCDVLLADTMGEMGLWYRLADSVYLGGGHTPGVGGHNPLEPIMLGKPVVTGPSLFNFEDIKKRLLQENALTIAATAGDIVEALPLPPISETLLQQLNEDAVGPMAFTIDKLRPYYERETKE